MFGLGTPELIVILVILFFLFGASRLPELGKGVGEAIRNFKKGITASGDTETAPKRHGEHEHGRHD